MPNSWPFGSSFEFICRISKSISLNSGKEKSEAATAVIFPTLAKILSGRLGGFEAFSVLGVGFGFGFGGLNGGGFAGFEIFGFPGGLKGAGGFTVGGFTGGFTGGGFTGGFGGVTFADVGFTKGITGGGTGVGVGFRIVVGLTVIGLIGRLGVTIRDPLPVVAGIDYFLVYWIPLVAKVTLLIWQATSHTNPLC